MKRFLTALCTTMLLLQPWRAVAADAEAMALIAYLQKRETRDPMLAAAARGVRDELHAILPKLHPGLAGAELFITEFDDEFPGVMGHLRIENCVAVSRSLPRASILCNAEFLREIELSIRMFEAGLLKNRERSVLDAVRKIAQSPAAHLRRFRDMPSRPGMGQSADHIGEHLKVALLFFVGHELGHLAAGADFASYAPSAGAVSRQPEDLRYGVLRACRHAKDFATMKFGLPGWDPMITDPGSEVRKIEGALREPVVEAYGAVERRYAEEVEADRFAVRIFLEYLSLAGSRGEDRDLYEQYLLTETLAWIGLAKWLGELARFADAECGVMTDSSRLTICMMKYRQIYLDASRLFGETHRFTLLRVHEAISALIAARFPPEKRSSIWPATELFDSADPRVKIREVWRASIMQMDALVRILMDTPVKLSYVACSTGWFVEIDKKRGSPQLLMMTFETIEQAIGRMRNLR